jgi:hypothetical protein
MIMLLFWGVLMQEFAYQRVKIKLIFALGLPKKAYLAVNLDQSGLAGFDLRLW